MLCFQFLALLVLSALESFFQVGVEVVVVDAGDEALALAAAAGALIVELPKWHEGLLGEFEVGGEVVDFFEGLVAFHLLFEVGGVVEVLALGTGSWLLEHFALFFTDHLLHFKIL